MREIKFRAWDTVEKRMVEDGEVMLWGNGSWGAYREGNEEISPEGDLIGNDPYTDQDMILMQFTGLHDKNGKEIFEGDIVEYENGNAGYGRPRHEETSRSVIPSLDDHAEYEAMSAFWKEGEVIGNVHQNKELLK